jgi:hypothetical protein
MISQYFSNRLHIHTLLGSSTQAAVLLLLLR